MPRLRGLGYGVLAGTLWWVVEMLAQWAAGSVIPAGPAAQMAATDVAAAAAGGLLLGLVMPNATAGTFGVGLAGVYCFLRVFSPPGMLAELLFVPLAAVVGWLGLRLAGPGAAGWLFFVQVTTLTAATMMLSEVALAETHAMGTRGIALLGGIAAMPLAGIVLDRILGLMVRGRGRRFALEVVAGLCAVVGLAQPLSIAPLRDPLVTGVPPPPGTPDIVLLSLDTTRADHLSTYGYPRETSPNLTEFAEDALLFEQARSTAGWTLPSHASILTGLYPSRHGARAAGGWLGGQSIDGRRNVAFPLGPEHTTLAEVLRDRGYRTAAFVANFSYLYRSFGMAQGFQSYMDAPWLLLRLRPPAVRAIRPLQPHLWLRPYLTGHDINAAALAWMDAQPRERPLFLFLNYMDAHPPYYAAPPFDQWVASVPSRRVFETEDLYTHAPKRFSAEERTFIEASYDGQLAHGDAALGELMAALKARGRYEQALIIVTSDHGTLLGEHEQVGHSGRMLYEALLHVPLVVKFPGGDRPRGRVGTSVQGLDVFATAVHAAGLGPRADVEGQVLPAVTHPTLAEEDINAYLVSQYGSHYDRAIRVLIEGRRKIILTSRGDRLLFDLAADPKEEVNRAEQDPAGVEAMVGKLRTLLPFDGAPPPS